MFRHAAALLLALALFPAVPAAQASQDEDVLTLARQVLGGEAAEREQALERLVARGGTDTIAHLVLALRFAGEEAEPAITAALRDLTAARIADWHDAMVWQETHPEIRPHPSFRPFKVGLLHRIDPNFLRFLEAERSLPENMDIRLEEITWGGVAVDGIPSLDNPAMIAAGAADYLEDDDLVFGVAINGDTRAYPLRILGWHEMFNDTIGGVPVALAYCTLCGAGILFETLVEGREQPLVFGSSGLLYRSNKLMFDRETDSLWNQFTGEPVAGPLRGSGIRLKLRPVTITDWASWRAANPETTVLSLETGHVRNYASGHVYRAYFASPNLMFPTRVGDESVVRRKGYVFGIRTVAAARAWPMTVFLDRQVINDAVGDLAVVLVGDATTRTVRAYERGERTFAAGSGGEAGSGTLAGPGGAWRLGEDALVGPDGTSLPRVAGHVAYWFAWDGYLGPRSTLYGADD